MINEMISVIIATFNSKVYLHEALDSVLNLQGVEWECIIIDGASKDGTIDVIKAYVKRDNRFKYISEPDNGIYDALNKGINMSYGEWIYVLGSDDTVTVDGLKTLLDSSRDYDVVFGDVHIKQPDGAVSDFYAKDYEKLKYVMAFSHQAVIVRRKVILRMNSFNLSYRIRADFDLMQRIYLAGYRFKQVRTFVANYSADGFSSNAEIKTHIERYHICKNNKSTLFPLFWYCYQESKFLIRHFIFKPLGV